jgi:hypothetical protein
MFERYTEKARRTIFFARYEASQFGSSFIETEHLLMGLLREDKALASRFLRSHTAVESIRQQIEGHSTPREKVSTSVDLPLSHECKRVLAYGAEEAMGLNHKHIGTEHLLLGLLREKECFAARLLSQHGLTLDSVRDEVQHTEPAPDPHGPASLAGLNRWLAGLGARSDIRAVQADRIANRTTQVALYTADEPKEGEAVRDLPPAERLAHIQWRIDSIVAQMEEAIARHEFAKARHHSDEERKEREKARLLREEFHLEDPPPRVPFLCIEVILEEQFSEVQRRCDAYLAGGAPQVWLLLPAIKRAYTYTKGEGLRECRGGILHIEEPAVEMDPGKIFG